MDRKPRQAGHHIQDEERQLTKTLLSFLSTTTTVYLFTDGVRQVTALWSRAGTLRIPAKALGLSERPLIMVNLMGHRRTIGHEESLSITATPVFLVREKDE